MMCPVFFLQPTELTLLHYLGAALSFVFLCLYMTILTFLTGKCVMTGCERVLYPLRSISTTLQISATILCILVCLKSFDGNAIFL